MLRRVAIAAVLILQLSICVASLLLLLHFLFLFCISTGGIERVFGWITWSLQLWRRLAICYSIWFRRRKTRHNDSPIYFNWTIKSGTINCFHTILLISEFLLHSARATQNCLLFWFFFVYMYIGTFNMHFFSNDNFSWKNYDLIVFILLEFETRWFIQVFWPQYKHLQLSFSCRKPYLYDYYCYDCWHTVNQTKLCLNHIIKRKKRIKIQ